MGSGGLDFSLVSEWLLFPLSFLVSDKCDIKPISHVVTKEATKLFMLYACRALEA